MLHQKTLHNISILSDWLIMGRLHGLVEHASCILHCGQRKKKATIHFSEEVVSDKNDNERFMTGTPDRPNMCSRSRRTDYNGDEILFRAVE